LEDLDTMLMEREEERLYEDRDNMEIPESPIDRMTWSSTASSGTTANYETE
jgi:hypothetical protein